MSVSLTQLKVGKATPAPTACLPVYYQASIMGYLPPVGYDLQYQFGLNQAVIQNSSLSNIVCFTFMRAGVQTLSCEVRLSPRYMSETRPLHALDSRQVLFKTELKIDFKAPGAQKAPCCVPMSCVTSPMYRVPVLQISPAPLVRVMIQPDMPKVPTGFQPPLEVPQPEEINFKAQQKGLKGYLPPLRQVCFTPWTQTIAGEEVLIPTIGMIPGKIYQVKHQIRDGQKKLELKQKLSFQADTLSSTFSVTPVAASEPKDRQFYYIVDSYAPEHLAFKLKSPEYKKAEKIESSVLSSYGHPLVRFANEYDAKDSFQLEAYEKENRRRIMGSNGQQVLALGSGVSGLCFSGFSTNFAQQTPQQIAADILQAMNVNVTNSQVFPDQQLLVLTTNGVPLRSIPVSAVNEQLYEAFQEEMKLYQAELESQETAAKETVQEPEQAEQIGANDEPAKKAQPEKPAPVFRPLVRFTAFQALENGCFIAAGQTETVISEHSELLEAVQKVAPEYPKLKNADCTKFTVLSAVVVLLSAQGQLLSYYYVADEFPSAQNFQIVLLQQPSQTKAQSDIPSYIPSPGYAIEHSHIQSIDATVKDALIALPKQRALIRVDFEHPRKIERLIDNTTVLSCSRVSARLHVLVQEEAALQVYQYLLPLYVQPGAKDIADILDNPSEFAVSDPDAQQSATETYQSMAVSTMVDDQTNELKLLAKVLIAQEEAVVSGVLMGLLKGGFVVGFKVEGDWRVIEVHRGEAVFASVVKAPSLQIARLF